MTITPIKPAHQAATEAGELEAICLGCLNLLSSTNNYRYEITS